MAFPSGGSVSLDAGRLVIDGEARLLLCSSLFYFRLPPEQWQDRLKQVRDSGYHAVDVYIPWNFHETRPGVYDFSGPRDVALFLDLAAAEGLHVMARPGPYICSEVDGGGLPAWLGLDPELRVRQNEPRFLEQATAWYRTVLPILAERQHGGGGSIILLQIENELDFFDCLDRPGYMQALSDAVSRAGISVPVIACAGQGDLSGATGGVPGVVPAANFYPDDSSPDIEAEVLAYQRELAARGLPLLVTETNRLHLTLRRELLAGARLIAPYLQSSGWNFWLNPSIGNWGDPGNFMTHSYDFGGYVSPDGARRPEYFEGRRLAGVIDALGARLASALPDLDAPLEQVPDFATSTVRPVLALSGGGYLAGLPNLSGQAGILQLKTDGGAFAAVTVPPGKCPLLLAGLPLEEWGVPAVLELATAELVAVTRTPSGLELKFADTPGAVLMVASDKMLAIRSGQADFRDNLLVAELQSGPGEVVFDDGVRLAWSMQSNGLAAEKEHQERRGGTDAAAVVLSRFSAEPAGLFAGIPATQHPEAPPLEALGVYAGRGRYRAAVPAGCTQLLVDGAADILSLSFRTAAGEPVPLDTLTPFGAAAVVGLPAGDGGDLTADVEIWGHSNFDDTRLPALSLGALRGTGAVMAVTGSADVSSLWHVHGGGQWAEPGRALRGFGGWSSSRLGVGIGYRKTLSAPSPEEDSYLHFAGLTSPISVCVGNLAPAVVAPENPYLRLPREAEGWDIDVTFPHDPSNGPGAVTLLSGVPLRDWAVQALPQEELDALSRAAATAARPAEGPVRVPLEIPAGEAYWLIPDLAELENGRGYFLRASGPGLTISAWLDGTRLGRLMPGRDDDAANPSMSGGNPGVIWLPAPMMKSQARLTLLLENRGMTAGRLETLLCEPAHS
ncbi:beta-galactosidase [Arthrobacter sp. ISL-48]|uniref:beta-galactosidase n=1 Tax=Arthrobacter sp. ISL-48 TaxID=2819110 RepID=UPI001BEC62BE|nr:beta-galactosidase [Arthrobacter sp. ISL-48]MBT2533557.1 beta-galactosidase [Arthrobacter sp. ISL-48]